MASLGHDNYVVIWVHADSASKSDVQFVMQREAQYVKVCFVGILPNNEKHVVGPSRVLLLRETGLSSSSNDLQLVRHEVVTNYDYVGGWQHVLVFLSSAPWNFIA
jgi:hypothetical protein